jgi:hypothetical protein
MPASRPDAGYGPECGSICKSEVRKGARTPAHKSQLISRNRPQPAPPTRRGRGLVFSEKLIAALLGLITPKKRACIRSTPGSST